MRVQWMIGRMRECIVTRAFLAARQGERLNPDSCKFTIVGILNSSSPLETGVEFGLETGPSSFDVEASVALSEEEL